MKKIILFFIGVLFSVFSFAQIRISNLPTLPNFADSGYIPISKNGITYKVRTKDILHLNLLPNKAIPLNTDSLLAKDINGNIFVISASALSSSADSTVFYTKYRSDTSRTNIYNAIHAASGGTPANPAAVIGLSAVNGTASTYMRSDAAPALSQSITPTWTSKHIFNIAPQFTNSSTTGYVWTATDASGNGGWAASSSGFADPLTTNNDVIARISGSTTRLPGGANGTFMGITETGAIGYRHPFGMISITDFGAVGDSVTDNTTAIQNAINSLMPSGGNMIGGGTIVIPPGRWKVTGKITIPDRTPIKFVGAGAYNNNSTAGLGSDARYGTSTIFYTNTADTCFMVRANGTSFSDLSIYCSYSSYPTTNVGIYVDSGNNFNMLRTNVMNFNVNLWYRHGVFFNIDNCTFRNGHTYSVVLQSYDGVDAGDSRIHHSWLMNDNAASASDTLLQIYNGGGIQIDHIKFSGGKSPINILWSTFSDVKIEDNSLENYTGGGTAIRVKIQPGGAAGNFHITNNQILGVGSDPLIYLDGTGGGNTLRNFDVSHNIFSGTNIDTAIYIKGVVAPGPFSLGPNTYYAVKVPVATDATGQYIQTVAQNGTINVSESATSMTIDLMKANYFNLTTMTGHDTLKIINGSFGVPFVLRAIQGTGNYHFVCGSGVSNSLQGLDGNLYIGSTSGAITMIHGVGGGFGTGAIITSIDRIYPTGSIPFYNKGMRESSMTYDSATQKLFTPNLKIGNSSTTGYVWTATNTSGDGSWQASAGGGGSIDTTSISNRINLKIDSIRRLPGKDSVYWYSNGTQQFAFRDSIGSGGGGTPGGSDTYVQFNDGGVCGGNAGLTFQKTTGVFTSNSATTAARTDGYVLKTTTAATSANPKWSPSLRFTGNAFNTTASASQAMDWNIQNITTSGASAGPLSSLDFSTQINGGGYNTAMRIWNNGWVSIGGTLSASALDVSFGASAVTLGAVLRANGQYINIVPITSTDGYIGLVSASSPSNGIHFKQDGSIGLGTSTMPARLNVTLGGGTYSSANNSTSGVALAVAGYIYNDNSTAASTTVPNTAINSFGVPTITATNTAVTYTNASTVYISGQPTPSTNMTITNAYALFVNNGNVKVNSGDLIFGTAGNAIRMTEGSNGRVGQVALVAGTKAITITGLTTSSRAFVTLVSQSGTVTTTTAYAGVCTANTLTINAVTNAGTNTIDTTDTSTVNYFIIN